MKTRTTNAGLKVTTNIKAGGYNPNHSRSALKVKTSIKAGMTCARNHSSRLIALA